MKSFKLDLLLKIGEDALNTTAQTLSEAINELVSSIANVLNKSYTTDSSNDDSIGNSDKVPFYDSTNSVKHNTTWSNIKAVLKTYFDTLYSKVAVGHTGTASGTTTYKEYITIDEVSSELTGTKYMELTQDISATDGNIFVFTNDDITADSIIDCYTSNFNIQPISIIATTNTCTVTVRKSSVSTNLTVRIYIK